MTAVELVATLRARGVELVPAGDRLRFRPGDAVTPDEREALRGYKAEVLALLTGAASTLSLDAITLRAVLGPRPDPAAVAALEAEVRGAIAQYRCEVATGVLGPGVLRVRGRPLSDYLDLDTLAHLLGSARPTRRARRLRP